MNGSVPVARRTMLADRQRLAVAVVGVGLALGLILLLEGLWRGLQEQISTYEDHVGAELFVAQPGTRTFLGDTSVIPASAVEDVRSVPGVQQAAPILARSLILDLHGSRQFAFLIAAEPGGWGGPWQVREGRGVTAPDEVVIDRTLAEQHDVGVRDRIEMAGERFRVVGLSADTRSWMASFVFVSTPAAERLFATPGLTSHVLVRTPDPDATARRIQQRTGLDVLPAATLAANDRTLITTILAAPIRLMVGVAFVAGTIIVALTVYSAIVERIREYGIVKAMGARTGRLFRIVMGQTLVLSALGVVAGFVVYEVGWRLVAVLRPQFWVRLEPATVLFMIGAAGTMALLAAIVPTRRIARLDPASVYRG